MEDQREVWRSRQDARAPRVAGARRRHQANPLDIATWHEVQDFQPRVVERLRMGGWRAFHIRQQGWRDVGLAQPGVVQGVNKDDGLGIPDWWCFHPSEPRVLVLELKAEGGMVDKHQLRWLARLAMRPHYEVAVVKPRHLGLLHERLVLHQHPAAWQALLWRPIGSAHTCAL